MKRRIPAFLAAAAVLFSMLLMALPVSAERNNEDLISNVGLYCEENFFTPETVNELNKRIQDTSRNIDMYVAVLIYDKNGNGLEDDTVISKARSKYIELFEPNTTENADGAMLVLNMSTKFIHVLTSGMGEMYFYNGSDDPRSETMVENLKPYLRSGDNVGAVKRFCSDLEYFYAKGLPKDSYTYNKGNGKYQYMQDGKIVTADKLPFGYGVNFKAAVGVSLVVGALVALIALAIIKSRYKLKKSLDPSNYISNKETNFYENNDIFLRTHTTKVRIDSDSGGGGGGGSSSSFGGHSFGGSSGHW